MAESEFYTPGVCNINPKEIAYRRRFAYIFGVSGAIMLAFLVWIKAPGLLGIVMFFPIWLGAISELQARNHFCVTYAAAGKYNASDKYADIAEVTEAQHVKDKVRASKMNKQAFMIGIVGAAACCLLLTVL